MTPAVSRAQVVNRVQGIDSSLGDLELHDGRKVALELGGTVARAPKITRTVAGSSSISLALQDSSLSFLDKALLAEKWDALLDGLWFRYMGADLQPPQVTLTLEDRNVALLREHEGPIKAYRRGPKAPKSSKALTRAEFIVARIREVFPRAPITCPQLHVVQPVKTEKQGKEAAASAETERGPGIGSVKGLKIKGQTPSPEQQELAEMALRIAASVQAPFRVQVALIAALIDETDMGAVQRGNVLAALEPYTKVRDAAEEINGFLTGEPTWTGTTAIGYFKANPQAPPHEIAQAVQKSATKDGSNYAAFEGEAREWVEAFFNGTDVSKSATVKEPYKFEIEEGEDFWTGIKRLAKDVNWLAFWVGDRFFYIAETDLFRSAVRLAIKREEGEPKPSTPGIEKVTFSFNANRKVTEVTVEADANKWAPPPGSVVTLEGYGPASIGSGAVPVKPNAKGQKAGIDPAVKAATHEGRGRYLVESIEAPLRDSDVSDFKRIIVKLRKPTAPLPEPAAQTKTTSTGGSSAGTASGNRTTERMLQAAEDEAAKKTEYHWAGGHDAAFTGPFDCSGFVSFELHVGGFLDTPMSTVGLAGWGEAGKGNLITVYVKTSGGAEEEHTAIEIEGEVFESGGGGENTNPNGGAGKVDPSQVATFLRQFDTQRHPKGF